MPDKLSKEELDIGEWIRRATDDELVIKSILRHRDAPPTPVCFHAQQMAEKYLKAFLVHHRQWYPKIHPLDKLAERLACVNWLVAVVVLLDFPASLRIQRVQLRHDLSKFILFGFDFYACGPEPHIF